MIRRLSGDVRGRLRTGVALTSVSQCVEELVLNAVDAGALCVAVRVDLHSLTITVVDNGSGIPKDQLPHVGQRYCTSKCHTVEDLDNLKYFGYRGEALASLCTAAAFVEVITRPRGSATTYSKCFRNGKPLAVGEPAVPRPGTGTTINAHNLFYNLPVRKKSLKEGLELEKIRMRVAGLALMWPLISFSLRDDITGNIILQTHKCSGMLATFSSLFGGARAKHLKEVKTSDDVFKISGYVSRENYSRKDLQFVFVNRRLVLKSKVHKLLNTVLSKSVLVRRRGYASDRKTRQAGEEKSPGEVGSPTKLFERHAVYVINIDCPLSAYDITFDPTKTLVEFHNWPELTQVVETMLLKFLKEENLLLPTVQEQDDRGASTSTNDIDEACSGTETDVPHESQDPFAGADERFDEEFHTELQRKIYTQGISTHNHLNSLFSRTVRRPAVRCEKEDFDDLIPNSPKKKKTDDGGQSRSDEALQSQPGPSGPSISMDSTQSSITISGELKFYSGIRCSKQQVSESSRQELSDKHRHEQVPSEELMREITLPKGLSAFSKRTMSHTSQGRKFSEVFRERASAPVTSLKKSSLASQFSHSSSLSRLKARLGQSSPQSLASSDEGRAREPSFLDSLRNRSTQRGNTETFQREGSGYDRNDVDESFAEIVLPPMKRPSLYRSKSVDDGQQAKCGKRTVSNTARKQQKDNIQMSDDIGIDYTPTGNTHLGERRFEVSSPIANEPHYIAIKARSFYGTLPLQSESVGIANKYPTLSHAQLQSFGDSEKSSSGHVSREVAQVGMCSSDTDDYICLKPKAVMGNKRETFSRKEIEMMGHAEARDGQIALASPSQGQPTLSLSNPAKETETADSLEQESCTSRQNNSSSVAVSQLTMSGNPSQSSKLALLMRREALLGKRLGDFVESSEKYPQRTMTTLQQTKEFPSVAKGFTIPESVSVSKVLPSVQSVPCLLNTGGTKNPVQGLTQTQTVPEVSIAQENTRTSHTLMLEQNRQHQNKEEDTVLQQNDIDSSQIGTASLELSGSARNLPSYSIPCLQDIVLRNDRVCGLPSEGHRKIESFNFSVGEVPPAVGLMLEEKASEVQSSSKTDGYDEIKTSEMSAVLFSEALVSTSIRDLSSSVHLSSCNIRPREKTPRNGEACSKDPLSIQDTQGFDVNSAGDTDSIHHREHTATNGTQGFLATSSQGFIPKAGEEGTMSFDINTEEQPSQTASQQALTESPKSVHSVGFSPSLVDPLLTSGGSSDEKTAEPHIVTTSHMSCIASPDTTQECGQTEVESRQVQGAATSPRHASDDCKNDKKASKRTFGVEGLHEIQSQTLQVHSAVSQPNMAVSSQTCSSDAANALHKMPTETSQQKNSEVLSYQPCSYEDHGTFPEEVGNQSSCYFDQTTAQRHDVDSRGEILEGLHESFANVSQICGGNPAFLGNESKSAGLKDSCALMESLEILCGQSVSSEISVVSASVASSCELNGRSNEFMSTVQSPAERLFSNMVPHEGEGTSKRNEMNGECLSKLDETEKGSIQHSKSNQRKTSDCEDSFALSKSREHRKREMVVDTSFLSEKKSRLSDSDNTGNLDKTSLKCEMLGKIGSRIISPLHSENKPSDSNVSESVQPLNIVSDDGDTDTPSLQQSDSFSDSISDSALAHVAMPEIVSVDTPQAFTGDVGPLLQSADFMLQEHVKSNTGANEIGAEPFPSSSNSFPDSDTDLAKITEDWASTQNVPIDSGKSVSAASDLFTQSAYKLASHLSSTPVTRITKSLLPRSETGTDRRPVTQEARQSGWDGVTSGLEDSSGTMQGSTAGSGGESGSRSGKSKEVAWIPVTDPATGNTLYMNSFSGHTLTEAQWNEREMDLGSDFDQSQDQRQTTATKTPHSSSIEVLSPLSHSTLQALLAEHFEADEDEAQSKWREGSKGVMAEDNASEKTLGDIMDAWENPVFKKPEQILQTSSRSQARQLTRSFFLPTAFTKSMLSGGKVIGQVDNKFVACLIQDSGKLTASASNEMDEGLVVLFDQHAAHERVRLEQLMADVYEKSNPEEKRICRSDVNPPRVMNLSEEDVRLMQSFRQEFERIGVKFEVDKQRRDTVHAHTIPACMAQREANDRKRGKDPLSYEYLEIMIREHNQLLMSTAGARQQLPQQIHRLLATHACKGAIKFGDKLSVSTCRELLSSLSACSLPFQCAHGRPSIAPLISLQQLKLNIGDARQPPSLLKLRQRMASFQAAADQ